MITETKRPGHFAPDPTKGKRGLRIKPSGAETTDGLERQICPCGTPFYAEAPGLCKVCATLTPQPSAAERLLSVKFCDTCEEAYGAELAECPACAAKQSPAKTGTPTGEGARPSSAPLELIEVVAAIAKIEVRQQTRTEFDEAKIEALAKEIEADGLLQLPLVRHHPEANSPGVAKYNYVLVDGERRIRAAKLLGWTRVKVALVSGEMNNARAKLVQGKTNIEREGFNDVDLARWCQWATSPATEDGEGGGGQTQQQLAEQLGVTQAEISNRIRLLRCPEWALELNISGQMSRKHCLELLAYEGKAIVLDAVEADVAKQIEAGGGLGTATEFGREILDIVNRVASPIKRHIHTRDGSDYKSAELRIDKNHPRFAELDVVTIKKHCGSESVALNAPLARQILNEKAKTWHAKHGQPKAGKKGGKADRAPTPGEAKKMAEAEQAKRREALETLIFDWRCWLCAEAIAGDVEACHDVALAAAVNAGPLVEEPYRASEQALDTLFPRKSSVVRHEDVGIRWLKVSAADRTRALSAFARGIFWDDQEASPAPGQWGREAMEQELLHWCQRLGVDLVAAWRGKDKDGRQAFCGPLTDRYFSLLDRDRLAELCEAWKVPVADGDRREALEEKIRNYESRVFPLPEELVELAGGKGKPKKKKK